MVKRNRTNNDSKAPMDADIFVGERVRAQRTSLGMSQTDLAKCLGITFQQIQKYEKGANRIGAGRLFAIAKVLRVPVSFFFDEAGAGAPSSTANLLVTKMLKTHHGVAMAAAFIEIPQHQQIALAHLARTLMPEHQVKQRAA